jgi:hypothetical protein
VLRDTKLCEIDLETKKVNEVTELAGHYYAKIIKSGDSLLAIGGQSKPLSQKNYQILREVT